MLAGRRGGARRDWSRRELGRAVLGAASVAPLGRPAGARAGVGPDVGLGGGGGGDSPLGRFCRSLGPEQRRAILFPADDPRRTMVQNHWAIVPATIADLTAAQQDLAFALIRQVCTPEGFARLGRQRDDDAGGWKHDHLAVFGTPAGPGPFEWVLTGRHLTLRGSAAGAVAGGPIFLGHTATGPANLGARSAAAAGTLFRTLDAGQRRRAASPGGAGLDLAGLGPAGRSLVRPLLAALVEPFRAFDVPAVRACLRDGADLAGVRWEVHPAGPDPADDPPRIWRLVGPGFAWSFHAEPHLHSWFESA